MISNLTKFFQPKVSRHQSERSMKKLINLLRAFKRPLGVCFMKRLSSQFRLLVLSSLSLLGSEIAFALIESLVFPSLPALSLL